MGPNTPEQTLLAAMAQWDQMRDGETRQRAERVVQDELHALRARNAELETHLAKHTEQRNADQAVYLDRLHHYEEQVQKLTDQFSECANDRRELSCGVVRLTSHITAGGGNLPTLLRRPDWYRRWAETGPTKPPKKPVAVPPDKPKPTPTSAPKPERWPDLSHSYQDRWGETVLQDLWHGKLWALAHLGRSSTAAERRTLLDKLIEHRLLAVHDPGHADVLTVHDELGDFAVAVGARLGARRQSVAKRVLDTMNTAEPGIRTAVLRALSRAGRDNHFHVHPGKPRELPLISVRPLTGPRLPARWLLPWLADQPELVTNLLNRGQSKDNSVGLIVAVQQHEDGGDDAQWGPLVRAAGYDPAEVKRLWLSPNG
ncbi:hypothetical protein [Crossiella cryophila]|uniref:Uncharacterized protein n=1 Tax=Crossiella cryophila TaxID=43355 RepID=A0A7W7C9Z0_9PSEU|nr:hypothetical protein [Crossiella cryophila]MBB4677233.1 hypothetical protein [Crossiella cryophila]